MRVWVTGKRGSEMRCEEMIELASEEQYVNEDAFDHRCQEASAPG